VPTYQYSCTECGHFFEQFQSFHEDSLTVCPQCQGRLRKVFNAVGVVFKGSGFYRTDSRTDSSGDGAATKGSGDKAGAGSTEKAGSGGKSGSGEKSGSGDKAGSSSGSSSSGTPASSGSSTSAA
jgi:putative FmdB family regulatory protein